MEEDISFERLTFENRYDMLEIFEADKDQWVDERFKDAEKLYHYVANLMIYGLHSPKHGSCDWLVYQAQKCIGVLHAFEFSREDYDDLNRQCFVGYAFSSEVRGKDLALPIVNYFIQFLFEQFDLLFVLAKVQAENTRSCRFLEKLGFHRKEGYLDVSCLFYEWHRS